ncbi:MAG TPA: hypothetical protein VE650_04725, partial [Acetobacteraceae bacterium]|nr:hypothetical protein [Acetobacteraceae bacterium]
EVEARDWLAKQHRISDRIRVRDLRPGDFYDRTFGAARTGLRGLMLGEVAAGAWAIWTGS